MSKKKEDSFVVTRKPGAYSNLCDFCPGYTVEESGTLEFGENEGYAMKITGSDGGEVGFCPDCLIKALVHGVASSRDTDRAALLMRMKT